MTNETTAPERIWANLNCSPIGSVLQGTLDLEPSKIGAQVEYVRADALEAAQARIAELEQHIADMIDDSGQECACGYENPTDICLGHLPMYRKAQARIAELEGVLASCQDGGDEDSWGGRCPTCGQKCIQAARAALEGKG